MSNECTKTKDIYINLIKELYPDMSVSSITSHISRLKTTYKDFYLDLKDRKETLELAQDMFIEVEGKDLKNLKEFKNKRPWSKNEFLSVVYKSRDSIPPKSFTDKCKRVIKQWEYKEDICRSCIYYVKETSYCSSLDIQTDYDFYCKNLEKEY